MKPEFFSQTILFVVIITFFSLTCFGQINAGEYFIVNADNNLVWDIDPKCTKETRECPVVLAAKSGKATQGWKIAPHDGFISIINISLDRIVSASVDFVQMNSYFPTNTNNFMAYPNSNGSFYLYQGVYDANETLHPGTKTLQPSGNLLHLAESTDSTHKKQSWLFVPFDTNKSDSATFDSLSNINTIKAVDAKKFTDQNAKRVEDLIIQGNSLKSKNDFDGAIKLFQQAVELDPKNDTAFIEMAGAYWAKKDYANATTYAEKSKAINPKNGLAWNLLGVIAKDQNDCVKAIPNFLKVIEFIPDAEYTFGNLGSCYEKLGEYSKAIKADSRAIEIEQKKNRTPEVWLFNNRGWYFTKLNKFTEALADYNQALEIDPKYTLAKTNLDWALKNFPKFEYSLENSPESVKPLINQFIEAFGKKDYQTCLNLSNKIIALDPNNPVHYSTKAYVYDVMRDFSNGQTEIDTALRLNPNDVDAILVQGMLFTDQGKTDEALAAYTKAIELGSTNYTPYMNRGNIYFNARKFELALQDFKKAVQLGTNFILPHNNLASVYIMLKKYPQAVREIRKTLAIDPKFQLALNNLRDFLTNIKSTTSDSASKDLWGGIKTNDNKEVNRILVNEDPRLNDTAEMDYGVHLPFLQVAIKNNNPVMVGNLLQFGADPDQKNSLGQTALMYAFIDEYKVAAQTKEIVNLLLDAGANPNIKDNQGETALNYAAKSLKSHDTILALLQAGAYIDNRDQNGVTPLMSCDFRCPPVIVKKMIDSGASLNATDNKGLTALDHAVNVNSLGNIYYLVKAGASIASIKSASALDFIKTFQSFPKDSPEAKLYEAIAANDLYKAQTALSSKDTFDKHVLTYGLIMAIDDNNPTLLQNLINKGANPFATVGGDRSLAVLAGDRRADNSEAYLKTIPGMGTRQTSSTSQTPTPIEKFMKAYDDLFKELRPVGEMNDSSACSSLSNLKQRVLDVRNMPNEFLNKDQIESINSMVGFFNMNISNHKCQNVQTIK